MDPNKPNSDGIYKLFVLSNKHLKESVSPFKHFSTITLSSMHFPFIILASSLPYQNKYENTNNKSDNIITQRNTEGRFFCAK